MQVTVAAEKQGQGHHMRIMEGPDETIAPWSPEMMHRDYSGRFWRPCSQQYVHFQVKLLLRSPVHGLLADAVSAVLHSVPLLPLPYHSVSGSTQPASKVAE